MSVISRYFQSRYINLWLSLNKKTAPVHPCQLLPYWQFVRSHNFKSMGDICFFFIKNDILQFSINIYPSLHQEKDLKQVWIWDWSFITELGGSNCFIELMIENNDASQMLVIVLADPPFHFFSWPSQNVCIIFYDPTLETLILGGVPPLLPSDPLPIIHVRSLRLIDLKVSDVSYLFGFICQLIWHNIMRINI